MGRLPTGWSGDRAGKNPAPKLSSFHPNTLCRSDSPVGCNVAYYQSPAGEEGLCAPFLTLCSPNAVLRGRPGDALMLSLIKRVRNLLLSPSAEWEVIDRETVEPRRLALGYVVPLVA